MVYEMNNGNVKLCMNFIYAKFNVKKIMIMSIVIMVGISFILQTFKRQKQIHVVVFLQLGQVDLVEMVDKLVLLETVEMVEIEETVILAELEDLMD